MSESFTWSTCALCPRLCRSSCAASTGSAREAAVPTMIAGVVVEHDRGMVSTEELIEAITLCTDCGGCQDHCHLDRPLPAALRTLRREHTPSPAIEPLGPVVGPGAVLAIESDDRPLGRALASALGEPVAVLRTTDDLGVAAIEHDLSRVFKELAARCAGRRVVVVSGGVAEVLSAAGIPFQWLRDVLPELPAGYGSCRDEGQAPVPCCGAAGPLARHHPEAAARSAGVWLERAVEWRVSDARCRAHLRALGAAVEDPLDALIRDDAR